MGIGRHIAPTNSHLGMSRIYFAANAANFLGGMQGGRLLGAPPCGFLFGAHFSFLLNVHCKCNNRK